MVELEEAELEAGAVLVPVWLFISVAAGAVVELGAVPELELAAALGALAAGVVEPEVALGAVLLGMALVWLELGEAVG